MKALIGFKAFYFFGSVSVRFRCVCEMALRVKLFFLKYVKYAYRISYMSSRVLSNLLNGLMKIDKMRGLPSILSLVCNEFNKFNDTGARMLDSHMTLKLLKILFFIFFHAA